MKHLSKLALLLIVSFAMLACGGSDDPGKVAEKFLTHLNKQEYEEAKKLGTESTVLTIGMIESMSGMAESFGGSAESEDIELEMGDCEVDGDKAKCTYTSNGEESTINLVKKDGDWLVDMKKEEM